MKRGRGRGKNPRSCEKILIILINAKGNEVTMDEIKHTLGNEIILDKLYTYFWELMMIGAKIDRKKNKQTILSVSLTNHEEMRQYAIDRGIIPPPPIELKPEDLMIGMN